MQDIFQNIEIAKKLLVNLVEAGMPRETVMKIFRETSQVYSWETIAWETALAEKVPEVKVPEDKSPFDSVAVGECVCAFKKDCKHTSSFLGRQEMCSCRKGEHHIEGCPLYEAKVPENKSSLDPVAVGKCVCAFKKDCKHTSSLRAEEKVQEKKQKVCSFCRRKGGPLHRGLFSL